MRKKSFSEAAMLQKIRRNCIENLVNGAGNPISSEDEIFLIRNHHPDKWDFVRLTEVILDALLSQERDTHHVSQYPNQLVKRYPEEKSCDFQGVDDLSCGIICWGRCGSSSRAIYSC